MKPMLSLRLSPLVSFLLLTLSRHSRPVTLFVSRHQPTWFVSTNLHPGVFCIYSIQSHHWHNQDFPSLRIARSFTLTSPRLYTMAWRSFFRAILSSCSNNLPPSHFCVRLNVIVD